MTDSTALTAAPLPEVIHGDCIVHMAAMAADGRRFSSIVTDPPYGIGFMNAKWDSPDNVAFRPETWRLALDLLEPGGMLAAFGGSRTQHRMACAIEDAGFEIRDTLMFLYGSGFPKSRSLRNDFCSCDNGVDQTHEATHDADSSAATQYDLRSVRNADVSQSFDAGGERGQVLFSGLPQQSASAEGVQRACDAGRGEPGLEGRGYSVQEKGQLYGRDLRQSAGVGAADGAERWLHNAASLGDGADVWAAVGSDGSGEPRGPQSEQQRAGEPQAVPMQRQSQESRMGDRCGRCGKPRVASDLLGFGTALKPAYEPIILARKPLAEKSVAANVLKYGTGAINIDGCRVPVAQAAGGEDPRGLKRTTYKIMSSKGAEGGAFGNQEHKYAVSDEARTYGSDAGRFPANILHDGSDEVMEAFAAFGIKTTNPKTQTGYGRDGLYDGGIKVDGGTVYPGDSGTAARFFYQAKASKHDRAGSRHPTVKPISLMRWIARLITPPGGTILDPFAGSGTTLAAAHMECFHAVGIEREAEYVDDIRRRIDALATTAQPAPLGGLFHGRSAAE